MAPRGCALGERALPPRKSCNWSSPVTPKPPFAGGEFFGTWLVTKLGHERVPIPVVLGRLFHTLPTTTLRQRVDARYETGLG